MPRRADSLALVRESRTHQYVPRGQGGDDDQSDQDAQRREPGLRTFGLLRDRRGPGWWQRQSSLRGQRAHLNIGARCEGWSRPMSPDRAIRSQTWHLPVRLVAKRADHRSCARAGAAELVSLPRETRVRKRATRPVRLASRGRRTQWGRDRRALPATPVVPRVSDLRVAVGRALVVGTVLAWLTYFGTWLTDQFITGGHHTARLPGRGGRLPDHRHVPDRLGTRVPHLPAGLLLPGPRAPPDAARGAGALLRPLEPVASR